MAKAVGPQTATMNNIFTLGDPYDKDFTLPDDPVLVSSSGTKTKIRGATIGEIKKYLLLRGAPKSRVAYFEAWEKENCGQAGTKEKIQIGDTKLLKINANGSIGVSCGPYDAALRKDDDTLRLAKATYLGDHIRIEILSASESASAKAKGQWVQSNKGKRKTSED